MLLTSESNCCIKIELRVNADEVVFAINVEKAEAFSRLTTEDGGDTGGKLLECWGLLNNDATDIQSL